MAQNNKSRKIIKLKKSLDINIGVIIFGITFIYIVINVFMYISRDKISYYEVTQGSLSTGTASDYTGIALRNEIVQFATTSGYINYYVREGNRASKNSVLYALDESGEISELLYENAESTMLTEADLKQLRAELFDFSVAFDEMSFDDMYDFKYKLDNTILEFVNADSLESINDLLEASGKKDLYKINNSSNTGIVVYSVDNYETTKPEDIKQVDFDTTKYSKAMFASNTLVESGSPIYKIIGDETWNIIIPLSNADILKYTDTTTINITFVKDGISTVADFEVFFNDDDEGYGKITLDNYMVHYATERFVDIQLSNTETAGLKIPKTSLIEKDFYKIPVEYASTGGNSTSVGFYKQEHKEDGSTTIAYITPTIYNMTDEYYLLDTDTFTKDDIIVKNDSSDRYQIGATEKLSGVYNINSGYTIFRHVKVLAESSEYYIVESGDTYGLIVYDHIVLDGSKVKESQVIFK